MIDAMYNSGLTVIAMMIYICAVFFISMFAHVVVEKASKKIRKYVVTLVFILLSITTILTCPKVIVWIWS